MELSVVVTTLNGREQLVQCLDALAGVPTECIVVNGPSSDGTTGMVQERSDVDVLVEISDRNPNVARNAGIEVASGDVVAFVGDAHQVSERWYDAVDRAIDAGADAVTGPTTGTTHAGDVRLKVPERVGGRTVTFFDGHNVAFTRQAIDQLDGFDEYLTTGGARDVAHRMAGLGHGVTWSAEMVATGTVGTDGGTTRDWGEVYRSIAYRLAKNYGLRPSVLWKTVGSASGDAYSFARSVASGEYAPSDWFDNGRAVLRNIVVGSKDGLAARRSDTSARRNPHGVSTRHDRAVVKYDWR